MGASLLSWELANEVSPLTVTLTSTVFSWAPNDPAAFPLLVSNNSAAVPIGSVVFQVPARLVVFRFVAWIEPVVLLSP